MSPQTQSDWASTPSLSRLSLVEEGKYDNDLYITKKYYFFNSFKLQVSSSYLISHHFNIYEWYYLHDIIHA
jgi:hypothetical protein